MQRKAVVLPQPDGPNRQAMLPFSRLKLRSENVVCAPYWWATPLNESSGRDGAEGMEAGMLSGIGSQSFQLSLT